MWFKLQNWLSAITGRFIDIAWNREFWSNECFPTHLRFLFKVFQVLFWYGNLVPILILIFRKSSQPYTKIAKDKRDIQCLILTLSDRNPFTIAEYISVINNGTTPIHTSQCLLNMKKSSESFIEEFKRGNMELKLVEVYSPLLKKCLLQIFFPILLLNLEKVTGDKRFNTSAKVYADYSL